MIMTELLKTIKERKSVRTFDGQPVRPEDRRKIEEYLPAISNPFHIPVRFVLLDAEAHGLSSPVLSGETLYAAGIVSGSTFSEAAYGFSFEKMVLYAWSLGIGTTWIGGTMKRELFERAAGLSEGEMMPCVTPLGYPAKKRSIRETMMRKGVGADSRMPADKLFFEEKWEVPMSRSKQDEIADLIEMVRWAPSAVNKQPWRIIASGQDYHFYEKQDRGYTGQKTGDLQKIDVGIALCHFTMGLEEMGEKPDVVIDNPGIEVPKGVEYIATVKPAGR